MVLQWARNSVVAVDNSMVVIPAVGGAGMLLETGRKCKKSLYINTL